jgi:ech hydrogenase subunit A
MAGENTGDNKNFYAAAGETRTLELRNWYMEGFFNVRKLTFWSNIVTVGILMVGVLLLIGGLVG